MEGAGSYYLRDAGVAVLRIGTGAPATTEEKEWGLIDYDGQGQVSSVEIWQAHSILPADLLAALPPLPTGIIQDPSASDQCPDTGVDRPTPTLASRDELHDPRD